MLVVKIELWPWGDESCAKEIGRTYIANTGNGSSTMGDYTVSVCEDGSIDRRDPFRRGEVKNYPRLRYNVWRLIIRALRSAFPEESNVC